MPTTTKENSPKGNAQKGNALRHVFGKRIGDLAVTFGLLDSDAHEQTLDMQTRYCALHLVDKPIDMSEPWQTAPLFTQLRDKWAETTEEYSITAEHIKEASEQVRQYSHGLPAQHVPAMGSLLHVLEHVEPNAIHALLTAQTAENILRTAESMTELSSQEKEDEGSAILEETRNAQIWGRLSTPGDPDYLTGNQRVLFIAKLLEAATRMHSPLAETEAIDRSEAALIILALGAFQEAGEHLPAIATQIATIMKEESARWKVTLPVSPALIHAALQAVNDGIEAVDISLGNRYADEQTERHRREKEPSEE